VSKYSIHSADLSLKYVDARVHHPSANIDETNTVVEGTSCQTLRKIGLGFVYQIGAKPKTFGFGIASHLDNLKYNGRLKKVETLISH
jgi:hypothetical protein